MHPRLMVVAIFVVAVTGPLVASRAEASLPYPSPTTSTSPPAVVGVSVSTPDVVDPGDDGGTATGTVAIPCDWNPEPATPAETDALNDTIGSLFDAINRLLPINLVVRLTYYSEYGTLRAWDSVDGRFEQAMVADCSAATHPGAVTTGDFEWQAVTPPSPDILIPGTVERATALIEAPTPAINPPDIGTINLGMWLAVEQEGPITIRAELGPIWVEATARIVATTFDLDDGPPIVCEGVGTPIPDSARDEIDEGPCGHTFTDTDDIGTTEFTITSRWTMSWVTSAGTSGTGSDITQWTTVPYRVREIQTVGR